jgi:hypothetical protein
MEKALLQVFQICGSVTKKSVQEVINICNFETNEHGKDHTEFVKTLIELKSKCTE